MSRRIVLILGGRSDIGRSVAHQFAKAKYDIYLAARDVKSLESDKQDLEIRYGIGVTLYEFDALSIGSHRDFVDKLPALPDVALCSIGYLGEQLANQKNVAEAIRVIRSNYEGPASIMSELANKFENRKSGTLIGISSVAGVRGRASNYIYGSAKAGFTNFLSGLRNRLAKSGVNVITVLPGYVDTKMTKSLNLPKFLTISADDLAASIFAGSIKKQEVIISKRWLLICTVLRFIPEKLFKNLSI